MNLKILRSHEVALISEFLGELYELEVAWKLSDALITPCMALRASDAGVLEGQTNRSTLAASRSAAELARRKRIT